MGVYWLSADCINLTEPGSGWTLPRSKQRDKNDPKQQQQVNICWTLFEDLHTDACVVCVVHKLVSGWHPIAPAASLPH